MMNTINLKLHQAKNRKLSIMLTISELKLQFNNSVKVKSTKISSLPWFYIISCEPDVADGHDTFVLSFFYPTKTSPRYFEKTKMKLSLDNDCAQEAEFSNAKDVCNVIDDHLNHSVARSDKPYLLIVNPRSGTQKALKIFNHCISELLRSNNVKYELMMTEEPLHARNFIKSCESLDKYRGVVTVSGDGLVFEVFCGIMDRDSWKKDIESTTVSVIPAGSGNGLAASLSEFSGINPNGNIVLYNTLILKNPSIQPLDLIRVQTSTGNHFPAFLSLTWGLIAHVDVGSDKFRWMGHARFHFVAAIQIAKMNKYKGKLWYLPVTSHNSGHNFPEESKENTSFANTSFRYLPDISQPIPDNDKWVLLDQSFISVIITLLPYISTDAKMAPKAKINDGKIHIIIINSDITRSELINCVTKLETGDFFNCRSINYIECLAFRLLPECEKCYMAIDGEYLKNTPIQAEIMPSVARTLTGPYADGQAVQI